ncbi:hypothetical protein LI148_07285 [Colidextribacter sp. 210702-DFI.3.9]|nr:hypothetical protein [Colidextribacter sp. 210702-DFI.3.9]MCG4468750.1 hypothetical protein [Lawsonibacter sp. DFI.6.74]MCG4773338.1 hypothetical protein [Lawsonibacter sp. DFI.5.51]
MAMNEKEWFAAFCEKPARRINAVQYAVENKIPKGKAGLMDECEEVYYERLWASAEEDMKKYGTWPGFERAESDTV